MQAYLYLMTTTRGGEADRESICTSPSINLSKSIKHQEGNIKGSGESTAQDIKSVKYREKRERQTPLLEYSHQTETYNQFNLKWQLVFLNASEKVLVS